MIICDVCGKEGKGEEKMNIVQLVWPNLVANPPVTVKQYHLCVECAKKVDKKIQELK